MPKKKSSGKKETPPKEEEPKEEVTEETPSKAKEPKWPEGWKEVLFPLVSGPGAGCREPKGLAKNVGLSQAKVNDILEFLEKKDLVVHHTDGLWYATDEAHTAITS